MWVNWSSSLLSADVCTALLLLTANVYYSACKHQEDKLKRLNVNSRQRHLYKVQPHANLLYSLIYCLVLPLTRPDINGTARSLSMSWVRKWLATSYGCSKWPCWGYRLRVCVLSLWVGNIILLSLSQLMIRERYKSRTHIPAPTVSLRQRIKLIMCDIFSP